MLVEALRAMGYTVERNVAYKHYGCGFCCHISTGGGNPGGVWFAESGELGMLEDTR